MLPMVERVEEFVEIRSDRNKVNEIHFSRLDVWRLQSRYVPVLGTSLYFKLKQREIRSWLLRWHIDKNIFSL